MTIDANFNRLLFEKMVIGLALCRLNGELVYINSAYSKLLGRSNEETLSLTYWEITPEKYSQQEGCQLESLEKTGKYGPYEKEYIHSDGHLIPVRLSGQIVEIEGENYIWSSVEDISDQKEAEKKLQEHQVIMAQQARMASMGEMMMNISHQWRQPLNALGLIQQKIAIYLNRDMIDTKKLNESIDKSMYLIQSMSATINDFIDFYHPRKDKANFLLKDAIEKAFNILESSFDTHSIELKTTMSDDTIELVGYKNELSQVIVNLLSNAKDALVENKISNAKVTVNVQKNNDKVHITVTDNAGGIPEGTILKIFDPYFTTKEEGKGTGIGLYMSKKIIEDHMNGILTVTNTSEGAYFSIEI